MTIHLRKRTKTQRALLMLLVCLSLLATGRPAAGRTRAAQSASPIVLGQCPSSQTINFKDTRFTITPPTRVDSEPVAAKVFAFSGTVDCNGNIVIPKSNLKFESVTLSGEVGQFQLQSDATGALSPNTGAMQLTLTVILSLSDPGSDPAKESCPVGPVTFALSTANGKAYSLTDGSATLAGKNSDVPKIVSSKTCTSAKALVFNPALGLPWAAGEASAALPLTILNPISVAPVENAGKWQEGESNNDASHANFLSGTPTSISGTLTQNDADYFSITIPKNTAVTISHFAKMTVKTSEPCDPNASNGSSSASITGPLVAINGKASYTQSIQETDTASCSGANGTKGFAKATTVSSYTMAYTFPVQSADRKEVFSVKAFSTPSYNMPTTGAYTLTFKFVTQ